MFSWIVNLLIKVYSSYSLPIIHGNFTLKGLTGETLEIIRDNYGVPHIYAQNEEDLIFGQGFVHAQDRLWQIESLRYLQTHDMYSHLLTISLSFFSLSLSRRVSQGILSEIIGKDGITADVKMRTFGFHKLAIDDVSILSNYEKKILTAYANGVNAYIDSDLFKIPVEFQLLRLDVHRWTIVDGCCLFRLLAFMMSRGFFTKLHLWRLRKLASIFLV